MNIFSPLNTEPEPILQQIELATFFQLPSFHLIGLPSPEVAEAKERVRSAIDASGFEFPKRRVVVNLSPASIRKRGVGIDLSIALAVLNGAQPRTKKVAAWGELGLDGRVKPSGQLTRSLYAAWKAGISTFFLSEDEYGEGLDALETIQNAMPFILRGLTKPMLLPVGDLKEAWKYLGQETLPLKLVVPRLREAQSISEELAPPLLPLNPALERMVAVAVTGSHHFLLLGPKGVGKSHALEWVTALQPPMSAEDRLFHHLTVELGEPRPRENLAPLGKCAVRRVGSQTRPAALTGGASQYLIFPGEFSLAHGGVLIADELLEWSRDSREVLREPLERGKVTVTRVKGAYEFPARFQMVANGNLCPCGGWPVQLPIPQEWGESQSIKNTLRCRCKPSLRDAYFSKLSGPILDRMDMVAVLTQSMDSEKQSDPKVKHQSVQVMESLRKEVIRAREALLLSWGGLPGLMPAHEVERLLENHPLWREWLGKLPYGSLRSRHKITRVAMTLASWDQEEEPGYAHFLEASAYRAEKALSLFN